MRRPPGRAMTCEKLKSDGHVEKSVGRTTEHDSIATSTSMATFLCVFLALATSSASAFSSPAPARRAGAAWLPLPQRPPLVGHARVVGVAATMATALPTRPRAVTRGSTKLYSAEASGEAGAEAEAAADDGPDFDEWKAVLDSLVDAGSKLIGMPPPVVMTEGNDTLTLTVGHRFPLPPPPCRPRCGLVHVPSRSPPAAA